MGHVRGSTDPDAFYLYLKTAKTLSIENIDNPQVIFPQELVNACNSISPVVIYTIIYLIVPLTHFMIVCGEVFGLNMCFTQMLFQFGILINQVFEK